jgi:hypothetical protein
MDLKKPHPSSLMKPMYLKIPNLLPPELSFRVLMEPARVNFLLTEQEPKMFAHYLYSLGNKNAERKVN